MRRTVMRRKAIGRIVPRMALAAAIASLPAVALAQAGGNKPAEIRQPGPPQITTPGEPRTGFVEPDRGDKSGPGSIATEVRGATGAESRSNNSGAAGNDARPELPVGNTGGGGSSGDGGG